MNLRDRKVALRREVIARVLAMDPGSRRAQEVTLTDRLSTLPGFGAARTVLLHASAFAEEVETRPILARALDLGKRLVCPRVDRAARRLRLFVVSDPGRDLVPGLRGIPEPDPGCSEVEPKAVDWALVPGLAFDRRGYRLGRGAGHYDRLLPTLRPDAPCWALVLDVQWVVRVPIEPHDQPLDGVADAHESVVGAGPGRLNR